MKSLAIILILGFFLFSCGTQKRILSARDKTNESKKILAADTKVLGEILLAVDRKIESEEVDSSTENKIKTTISDLRKDLNEIEKAVKAVDFFLVTRSNFSRSKYGKIVGRYIEQIDSFNVQESRRNRIYELLHEAVRAKTFEKYGLAAFFDPGVYKISSTGSKRLTNSFLPAIDSIAALSNRYRDIKRSVHMVIVGYADALPYNTGKTLYKDLKNYLQVENPSRVQLNLALSDLRAAELLKNLKNMMKNSVSKFANLQHLTVGYVSYGRGEELPFKNITNYTDDDERRRVVVFYWAVLPEVEDL